MTCKDAINSDTSSDDKKWYLLNENTSYNKIFESDLQGTNDQNFGVIVESKYEQVLNNFLLIFLHDRNKD
jgi:hypothetical protein